MKPAVPFSKATDQVRLRQLKLERSNVTPPGRAMFCRGRRIIDYGNISSLGGYRAVPDLADTICVSAADYADLKEWGL